jgi:hypothetical protein
MMRPVTTTDWTTRKIAVRISTTRLEIIMTTDSWIIHSPDVYVQNEGIVLPRGNGGELSAVTVLTERVNALPDARLLCLREAVRLVTAAHEQAELWLLACQTAWQQDRPTARFNALWKGFERAGIQLPDGKRGEETIVVSEHGVRWFGGIQFPAKSLDVAEQVVAKEQSSLLVAMLDAIPSIEAFLAAGWSTFSPTSMDFWASVAESAASGHGLLLRLFGAFDDREAGVNIIGRPSSVHALLSVPAIANSDAGEDAQ